MDSIETLCWTSRTEVCKWLVQYLRETSPSVSHSDAADSSRPRTQRYQAARLLTCLAGLYQIWQICDVLRNDREELSIRAEALMWLSERRTALPARYLEPLLADPELREEESGIAFDHHFFPLCVDEEGQAVARRYLESLSPGQRAEILSVFSREDKPGVRRRQVPPPLLDWLYERWLTQDRLLLEETDEKECRSNLRAMVVTRYRPRSEALLRSLWRNCLPEERRTIILGVQPMWDLADKSWDLPGDEQLVRELLYECAEVDPATLERLLENLELPLGLLQEHVGAKVLLERIMQQIEVANELLREKKWSARTETMARAYHLLRHWPDPEVNARVARMLCRPDPSPKPRQMLFWVLWDRDRDMAHAVARRVAEEHGDRDLLRQSVRRLRSKARHDDEEFLLGIVAEEEQPETLCMAVQALEQLGAGGPRWAQRLHDLSSHSDPHVRLQAIAALVRRGDESLLPVIVEEATRAARVQVRAAALSLLGGLDAARYLPLLRNALLTDYPRPRGFSNGEEAASAAAHALARLGTPEAMTALLRACLTIDPERRLAVDLCTTLARLSQEQEGPIELGDWPRVGETGGLESTGTSAFEQMNEADQRIIGECLKAVVEGPFIPEWEFHTLFGLYRWEVGLVVAAWPKVDDSNLSIEVAINNSMNNLLGYPIDGKERWPDYISVPPTEVARVFAGWRRLKKRESMDSGSAYVNCAM